MAAALNKASVKVDYARLKIDPRQLAGAHMEWRKVSQSFGAADMVCSLAGSELGPAAFCPACAVVPADCSNSMDAGSSGLVAYTALACAAGNPELAVKAKRCGLFPGVVSLCQVGPSGKPVLPVACFDANAKANRYQKAGKASSRSFLELPQGHFFAQAHADVWQLKAAGGSLPLSSTGSSGLGDCTAAGGADDAELELEVVVEDSCHPRLTCARETSLCSSISDVCGVAAGVCSHGQPLVGAALAMPAPERFLYYDLILSHLSRSADVRLMYLDTGCSYAAHWRLYMPSGTGPSQIKVPWWHAQGHGAACYVKNSGLYLPGSGRLVGENCEHLWAAVRPLLKLTRYMTRDAYVFCLDDGLFIIAEDKLGAFVVFMEEQQHALEQKLRATRAKIHQAITAAGALGFSKQQLLEAAVDTLSSPAEAGAPSDESPEAQRLCLLAEYVRCSEEESVLRTLQDRRSALAVALPTTERQLQSQAQHDKRVGKLVDRMAKLMRQLQLQEPLAEDSPEYQQGLAALRDEQLRHLQQQIEREAAALAEVTHGRRQLGAACEQTRNQDRKAKRRRTCIRQLVDTMWTWQQKALPASAVTQQLPAQWTEQAIKELFAGQFPWQHTLGGLGQLPSLLVERFRDACAEEARSLEELEMQHEERRRTILYFKHLSSLASAAAAECQATRTQLAEDVSQHVVPGCDLIAVSGGLKSQLQRVSHMCAQQLMLESWAERFKCWSEHVLAVFGSS